MAFEIPFSIRPAPADLRTGSKAGIMAITDAAVETATPGPGNAFLMGTDPGEEIART